MYSLSPRSRANMIGVDQRLIDIAMRAIEITTVDFGIPAHGGLRSVEVQAQLFDSGKTKADGVNKISKHQFGQALDFFPYVNGSASYTRGDCGLVAAAFLQAANEKGVKIRWGGHFKGFFDGPHIELV